ncbi:MAG: class I SAM-dependent methyltransferase [Candidatus Anammoxibacter sp.]
MTTNILEYLKRLIKAEGRITFARYMDIALYHPEFGYYCTDIPKIGKDGDYYTGSDVHPFMGQVLGAQLIKMWEILGREDFYIVEMGAGKGLMALDILEYIKDNSQMFYKRLTYIIIERSKTFKAKQKKLLAPFNGKTQWLDSISCFNDSKRITGTFISNELVDALPFHRVYQDEDGLKELFVTIDQDKFIEEVGELSTDKLSNYIKRLKIPLTDGMKTEINLEAMNWMKSVAAAIHKGFAITIDYGFPAHLYYEPSRTKGTFLCYHNHSVNEKPFERIGKQDITAHVDFTSLALEGKESGLDLLSYTNLSSFLISYGKDILEKEMEKIQSLNQVSAFKASSAIKNLIHPEGMGGKFKVLIQCKNVGLDDGNNIKDNSPLSYFSMECCSSVLSCL